MRKAEVVFFSIAILVPLISATSLLIVGAYNVKFSGFCWVMPDPYVCRDSNAGWCAEHQAGWSRKFGFIRMVVAQLWIAVVMTVIFVSMVLLYLTVRSQEQRVSRWSSHAHAGRSQKTVVKLAAMYLGTCWTLHGRCRLGEGIVCLINTQHSFYLCAKAPISSFT